MTPSVYPIATSVGNPTLFHSVRFFFYVGRPREKDNCPATLDQYTLLAKDDLKKDFLFLAHPGAALRDPYTRPA